MAKKKKEETSSTLQTKFAPAALPDNERLYIGIDVSKDTLHAGFISQTLLKINRDWKHCPYLPFPRTRDGFNTFLATLKQYVPLDRVMVLFEHTGHYSLVIQDLLIAEGITAYRHHVRERPNRLIKNDKRDSLYLAGMIYNSHEMKVETAQHLLVKVADMPPLAAKLKPLAQRYHEVSREVARRHNQLTSLCDVLIPELTSCYKDPNSQSALAFRAVFPTYKAIQSASIDALCAARLHHYPQRADLEALKNLIETSIGVRDELLAASLVIEQKQLMAEVALLEQHKTELDVEITKILSESREAAILMSFTGINTIAAATLLASMMHIGRFGSHQKLRSYWGWAPGQAQTGISLDSTSLPKRHMLCKKVLFLVVINAIQHDPYWKERYTRAVERKCAYDAKKEDYVGKMKVVGQIAGEIIGCIYYLLKKDHDLVKAMEGCEGPQPLPEGFDPEKAPRYRPRRKQKANKESEVAPMPTA